MRKQSGWLVLQFALFGIGGCGEDGASERDADIEGDGGSQADADGGDDACPDDPSEIDLGTGALDQAAAGDMDGDGILDLVVAPSEGGLAWFTGTPCGMLEPSGTALDGAAITGLVAGDLDDRPGMDVAAFDEDRELYAISGVDRAVLWSSTMDVLPSAGPLLAAHLDRDADSDIVALDADLGSLLRIENDGAWTPHVNVVLPPGIESVGAGDVGGNERDEIFFLGFGLVQVVSVGDYDYSDVRFLSATFHAAAAVLDADDDGDGDAFFAARTEVERWLGDGSTTIELDDSVELDDTVVDVASMTMSQGRGVVAFTASGDLFLLTPDLEVESQATGPEEAMRVFGGALTPEGDAQAIAIGADGTALVWRP